MLGNCLIVCPHRSSSRKCFKTQNKTKAKNKLVSFLSYSQFPQPFVLWEGSGPSCSSHSPLILFQSVPQELCPSERKATFSHCEPTIQSIIRRPRSPLSWPLTYSYCITIFFSHITQFLLWSFWWTVILDIIPVSRHGTHSLLPSTAPSPQSELTKS